MLESRSDHAVLLSTALPTGYIDTDVYPAPYHLMRYIEDNKHKLQPPVNNMMLSGVQCQVCVWSVMSIIAYTRHTVVLTSLSHDQFIIRSMCRVQFKVLVL